VLTLMAASGALYGLAHLSRTAAISIGVHRAIAQVAAVTFAFNVVANLIVIPPYGFVGAAWTTLATEIVEAAGFTLLFVRGSALPRLNVVAVPALAAGGTIAVLAAAGARNATALVLAVVAYPPLLFVAGRLLARRETTTLLRLLGTFRRRLVHT
jgi:O-antigen/teichoic acid export membrane protein